MVCTCMQTLVALGFQIRMIIVSGQEIIDMIFNFLSDNEEQAYSM